MKKKVGRADTELGQLCQDICQRVQDRQQLHDLVVQLQCALGEATQDHRYRSKPIRLAARSDNPFDRIIVN